MKTKKLVALLLVLMMLAAAIPSFAAEEEPVTLRIMIHNVTEVPEGSIAEKWQHQVEEKLNIKIEWVMPPKSAYEDNLQLIMINKDKPDVLCFPTAWLNQTSFIEACEYDMFLDLSAMLENYPNITSHTSQISWDALDIFNDGRIWGVPRSSPARADGFTIRKDWLDNLGIEYNEGDFLTLDEFYDLLYAFTFNDPDGNGVNDTYGMYLYSMGDGSLFSSLSRIFHIGDDSWYEMPDGTVTNLKYSQDYDYYKQYLEFANKCWEAGVIEPDAFAIDQAIAKERIESYGIEPNYPGNMRVVPSGDSPRYYVYCPGVVLENDPIGTYTYGITSTGIWYYYAITDTCEHPEKVLELFNYVLSDEQWTNLNAKSLIDVGFVLDEAGNYDFSLTDQLKENDKANGTKTANTSLISNFLRRADGAEFFIDKSLSPENQKRIADLINVSFELYWPAVDRGYKPEISTDPVFIEYKSYLIQEEAKIITGDMPVEHWDEVLQGFYDAGYAEYTEDMIEYVNSFKK